jgi:integrase
MTTTSLETTDDSSNRFPFTAKLLAKIPLETEGPQKTYYDTNFKGLGLRVGAKTKTFILYKRVKGGKPVRITLGQYGIIGLEDAKKLALAQSVVLNDGINPLEEKKTLAAKFAATQVDTVQMVFDYYVTHQIKSHKKNVETLDADGKVINKSSTLKDIDLMLKYFGEKTFKSLKLVNGEWVQDKDVTLRNLLNIPFRELTPTEILERFKLLETACPARIPKKKPLEPIKRTHQLTFKYANSAFGYYIGVKSLIPTENYHNPFDILTSAKKWKKTSIRKNYIDFKDAEGYAWWKAVSTYNKAAGSVSDYFIFSLLQAGRSIDIAALTWDKVDFARKEIRYVDTKNEETYVFPLTKLALEILQRRKKFSNGTDYIFEYPNSKDKHVPPACKDHFNAIGNISGKHITHHDLRRTWATQARMLKIDGRTIDYCLKHKIGDVNEHYYQGQKKEIYDALQLVENTILELVKSKEPEMIETEMAA